MTESKPLKIAMKLLMELEDLRTTAYDDGGGVWTIGYGHTLGVKRGMTIDTRKAMELLELDAANAYSDLTKSLTRPQLVALDDMQLAALISFCFSIGGTQFATSTLAKRLREGNYKLVPEQMQRWNKVNDEVWPGLVTRRYREAMLWLGCMPEVLNFTK